MALGTLRTRKHFLFWRTISQLASVNHIVTMSSPPYFEDKCNKIGAVVTRTGTESSRSPVVALLGWNSIWLNTAKYLKKKALTPSGFRQTHTTLSCD